MGVLVAISIPIFTAQLQKARLGTNMANARAAKSAAVADWLASSDDKKQTTVIYKYDDSTGEASIVTTAGGNAVADKDITAWKVDTAVDKTTLGKTVFDNWYITVQGTTGATDASPAGSVTAINAEAE